MQLLLFLSRLVMESNGNSMQVAEAFHSNLRQSVGNKSKLRHAKSKRKIVSVNQQNAVELKVKEASLKIKINGIID